LRQLRQSLNKKQTQKTKNVQNRPKNFLEKMKFS